jgi:hypothetical protein
MSNIKTERSYYPNGQLRWEGSFDNGKPVGTNRQWHENGVLSSDCSYKDGLEHGIAKQWNNEGKLLGEYKMDHGTGVRKNWYENGQLHGETSFVKGQFCGRFRIWFEDGDFIGSEFYIRNRKISKKKYDEACKSDPTLPRYEDKDPKTKLKLPSTKYQKRKTAVSEKERKKHEEFIAKFRAQANQAEAREWLSKNENRNIGEMAPEESRETIEEGYKAGAIKITVVEIQDESTNCLIVELPQKETKRRRVFEWNNELAQNSGFDPNDYWGQNELFVFFA